MNTSDWNIIDVYSRKQAIADGVQVLASPATTAEAGIKFPVYFTATAYNKYVKVPEGMEGWQQEDARLWDIFTMFKYYARGADTNQMTLKVSVSIPNRGDWTRNEKRERDAGPDQRLVTLFSEIGPFDFDDPSPAITIMIPGED
jgi:hypothetical protein